MWIRISISAVIAICMLAFVIALVQTDAPAILTALAFSVWSATVIHLGAIVAIAETKPLKHPRCAKCHYDQRGHHHERCPECGHTVSAQPGQITRWAACHGCGLFLLGVITMWFGCVMAVSGVAVSIAVALGAVG